MCAEIPSLIFGGFINEILEKEMQNANLYESGNIFQVNLVCEVMKNILRVNLAFLDFSCYF